MNQFNLISDVIKINHSHERNYEKAINTGASTYINNPEIVTYINSMADQVRQNGRPYEFITYITTPEEPHERLLCRLRFEKFTDTDLIVFWFPF